MANYYGKGRSNYFKVNDPEKLKRTAKYYQLQVVEKENMFALIAESDSGSEQQSLYIEDDKMLNELITLGLAKTYDDGEEDIELPDFNAVISALLIPGEVFVWIHVGNENHRYLNGYAAAVNNEGKTLYIRTDQIYDLIKKEFGIETSLAEY